MRFRPNWKIALFTLLFLPLMLKLGFWQLDRAAEKQALEGLYQSRLGAQPEALDTLLDNVSAGADLLAEDLGFMPVRLTGHYDNQHVFLLDNRIYQGRAGYEVLQPFQDQGTGLSVLVNRGWIAPGPTRQDLPSIPLVEGEQSLEANIHVPQGEPILLAEDLPQDTWPRVVQSLTPETMLEEAGHENGFPYTLRLQEGMAGVLIRDWPTVAMGPEKHQGYAFQWFAMSTALLILFLYSSLAGNRPAHSDQEEH